MIIVVTENARKVTELRQIFGRYNIALEQVRRDAFDEADLPQWFRDRPKLKAVLDETSRLTRRDDTDKLSDWRDTRHHLLPVVNRGRLVAWTPSDEGVQKKIYERQIVGWIDHTASAEDDEVFDWDAVFVVAATGVTYDHMRRRGLKNSVRDLVTADFLITHVYFDQRVDLNWSPRHQAQTVDFDSSVAEFIDSNALVDRSAMAPYGLSALLDHVLADGVFFRSAENRRQRNYWAPGLNGGIPLTPKSDPVHEITFMMHDIMHQALPDLVFTGIPQGEDPGLWRNVYCVWRMLSEAFTIVLADMLFVDGLVRSGLEYDFAKRGIWPLYAVLDIDFTEGIEPPLRKLLWANARYALLGDTQGLRALARPGVSTQAFDAALADYCGKYEGYFRADWRWTVDNFDAMVTRGDVFGRWGAMVGPELFERCGLSRLDDLAREVSTDRNCDSGTLDGIVSAVFERAFARIADRVQSPACRSDEAPAANGARRFFVGQALLFATWDFLPNARQTGLTMMRTLRGPLDRIAIERLERLYAANLDQMVARQMISEDDRRTWLGAHPLFDPSYVSYDAKGDPQPLAEVAQACFATHTAPHVWSVQQGVRWIDLDALWRSIERVPMPERSMRLMVAAGVPFYDDACQFIRAPVAAICGVGGTPVRQSSIDVERIRSEHAAMMGFSADMAYLNPADRPPEAMFDVIAKHGHFSVAHTVSLNILVAGHSCAVEHELACQRDILHLSRLTVARTPAQASPPVVVLEPELLEPMQRVLRATQHEVDAVRCAATPPRRRDKTFQEAVNIAFPAAKGSLVLLTASLRSFQKLMGGLSDDGKEEEYKRVLATINDSLHALWPQMFDATDDSGFTRR